MLVSSHFTASKKLYAIDLNSFHVTTRESVRNDGIEFKGFSYTLDAVWFRKRNNGKLAAFIGTLSGYSTDLPGQSLEREWTIEDFFQLCDGRYGGNPHACWDGDMAWWGSDFYKNSYPEQQKVLPFLQSMLKNFPQAPTGYTGWFKYQG